MKTLLTFFIIFLSITTYAQTTCGCIQVLSTTDNIKSINLEQFTAFKDTALIDKEIINNREYNNILYCYSNIYIAMQLSNKFNKVFKNTIIVERKSNQIENLPKLFTTAI